MPKPVDDDRRRDAGAAPRELLADEHAVDDREPEAAVLLGHVHVHEPEPVGLGDDPGREGGVAVEGRLVRADLLLGELVGQRAQRPLLLGQGEREALAHAPRWAVLRGGHQKKMGCRRMARPMSPFTLSLPVMKAICGLSFPLTRDRKSLSDALRVMFGSGASPGPTVHVPPRDVGVPLPAAFPAHVELVDRLQPGRLVGLEVRWKLLEERLHAVRHAASRGPIDWSVNRTVGPGRERDKDRLRRQPGRWRRRSASCPAR